MGRGTQEATSCPASGAEEKQKKGWELKTERLVRYSCSADPPHKGWVWKTRSQRPGQVGTYPNRAKPTPASS